MSIETRVLEVCQAQLGVDHQKLVPKARFVEDLGADSLDTVELVMGLEEEFDIEIPDEHAEMIKTVGGALDYVTEALGDPVSPPVIYRQGDVLLRKVSRCPEGIPTSAKDGWLVLAEGAATGHRHQVAGAANRLVKTSMDRRVLVVEQASHLRHPEHDPIPLEPGNYAVILQREWSDRDEAVTVKD